MINIENENLIHLHEVPKRLPSRPNGRRIHISAIYRWVQRGIHGRRLEVIKIGGTTYTSLEALQRFGQGSFTMPTSMSVTSAARRRQIVNASKQVDEILRLKRLG